MSKLPPILVLRERAEARAYLYFECSMFDSPEQAISPLLDYANRHRLNDLAVNDILDRFFQR